MNKLMSLYRILMGEMMMLEKKDSENRHQRNAMEKVFGLFVVVFVFIPFMFLIGFFTYFVADMLSLNGDMPTTSLSFLCIAVSVLCALFGFSVIMHTLFFASDTKNLLPLPINHNRIVTAKFMVCYMAENVMQTLILIAGFAGFIIAVQLDISVVLTGIVAIITLPLVPLCYCTIISLLLMRYTPFIRKQQVINRLVFALGIVLLVLFLYKGVSVTSFGVDGLVESIANTDSGIMKVMFCVFPNVYALHKMFAGGSILWLLVYLIINAALFLLVEILCKYVYIDALNNVAARAGKRTDVQKLMSKIKPCPVKRALLIREFKSLYRSFVFLSSCILVNFFWPVLAYFIVKMNFKLASLQTYLSNVINEIPSIQLIYLCVILGGSLVISSVNSICSSSFSREGKVCFQYLKSLPVSTKTIVHTKAKCGIGISMAFVLTYVVVFLLIFKVPYGLYIPTLVCAGLGVITSGLIGIYIDAISPCVLWEEEQHVLRGNLNTFTAMVAVIMVFVGIVLVDWLLLFRVNLGIVTVMITDIVVLAWIAVIFYRKCCGKGIAAIINYH